MLIDKGAEVDARDDRGFTPLRYAAGSSADPEVLRTLIRAGANVNATSRNGGTPLFSAAATNENPEIFTVLINAGAKLNTRLARSGDTPLMLNAGLTSGPDPEVLTVLINAGAEVNARNNQGRTALDIAMSISRYDNTRKIDLLRAAGAKRSKHLP